MCYMHTLYLTTAIRDKHGLMRFTDSYQMNYRLTGYDLCREKELRFRVIYIYMRKMIFLVSILIVVTVGVGIVWKVSHEVLENYIIGKEYLVLLQNNMELRPSGGFMGSFATVKFGDLPQDCIKKMTISVEDIYEPDGKLDGHVEPPYPVQEAFGQGWWKLRDANWDVDYASAAAAVDWFMSHSGRKSVDGVVAINQSTVNQIIGILGPIKLETYDEVITDKNFYQLAQRYAEVGGDKRGFLGMVGVRLIDELRAIKLIKLMKLIKLIKDELNNGQILVWMKDPELQKIAEKMKWAGRLTQGWNGEDDYLYIVESNLGTNKANCCVKRMITHEINSHDEHVIINWENNNEFEIPRPPVFWGGDYRDYVRIVIPASHKLQAIKLQDRELRAATLADFAIPNSLRQGMSEDMYVIEQRGDLQIIGFWAVVPAQETVTAEVSYTSPPAPLLRNERGEGVRIFVRRQPGMESFAYKLIVEGKIEADVTIDRDTVISR